MASRSSAALVSRVLVQVSHRKGRAHAKKLQRLALRFLDQLGLQGAELSLSLVDDGAIQTLNREWREKNRPTDVLSFPAGAWPAQLPVPRPLGDVIISLDTAVRQAEEEGRTLDDELARYLAHGLLHLLGHDHEHPREARAMARLEDALLGGEGMVRAAGVVPPASPRPRSTAKPQTRTSPKSRPARNLPGHE